MFERFTDAARQIVVQAQSNARRLGHTYIGCEHLLLAVAATGEPASVVLRDQGVTPERVEAEILRVIGRGPAADIRLRLGGPGQAPIPADPLAGLDREALAKKSLELSVREAVAMKDSYIGVQHLALALLAMKDGIVPEIMSALGVSIPSLRAAILDRYRQAS